MWKDEILGLMNVRLSANRNTVRDALVKAISKNVGENTGILESWKSGVNL